MPREKCAVCRVLRTVALAILLGTAAGFAVLELGGSAEWSMAATFFAAVAPVMWHTRHSRSIRKDVG